MISIGSKHAIHKMSYGIWRLFVCLLRVGGFRLRVKHNVAFVCLLRVKHNAVVRSLANGNLDGEDLEHYCAGPGICCADLAETKRRF